MNAAELFELFFKDITPSMSPPSLHHTGNARGFWEARFLNAYHGLEERDLSVVSYAELPIMWLAAWRQQQVRIDELQKRFDSIWIILEGYKDSESGEYNTKQLDVFVKFLKDSAKARNTRCSCGSMVLVVDKEQYVVMHCPNCGGQKTKEQIEQALKGECKHESDGSHLLSNPPKTKCKKCGEFYSVDALKGGEPKTKYDWSIIPDYVEWMATDEDGVACGWLVEPGISGNAWRHHSYYSAYFFIQRQQNPYQGDWRQSLEKRPDHTEQALKDGEE